MSSDNEPHLFTQEEVYLRLQNGKVTYQDTQNNQKVSSGHLLLTTNRLLFYLNSECVEVPLHNVERIEKVGHVFSKDGIKLHLFRHGELSPNIVDIYQNVLRRECPAPPGLPSASELRFHDSTRNRCLELLEEAHRGEGWKRKVITESMQHQAAQQMMAPPQQPGRVYGGVGAIKARKEQQTAYSQNQITDAFSDLESLKEKSRVMVTIAEQIKGKLARNELDGTSEEMKEIQAVMFNMGIASDFSTQVSKDTSGKMYHQALALEIEKFLATIIENFGGVVGLVDLYCMYNRARGTDLISPNDLEIACQRIDQSSQQFMTKKYPSGVVTIQSRMFNEGAWFQRLADTIQQSQGGMSANKLAEQLNINVSLMKEHLQAAEEKGAVCRDESYEGVVYYENRFNMAA